MAATEAEDSILKDFDNVEEIFHLPPFKNGLGKLLSSIDQKQTTVRRPDPARMINRKVTGKTRCMGIIKRKPRRKIVKRQSESGEVFSIAYFNF